LIVGHRPDGLQLLDVAGDHDRPDLLQASNAAGLQPREKLRDGLGIGRAGVFIADVGSEEIDEAPGGVLAGAADRCGELLKAGLAQLPTG
jgi:hypothetical protein